MNLVEDPWIPARRRSGAVGRITPWELTEDFDTDPWVELAAPRPDFDGALVQFLIGLLQTCLTPADTTAWRARLSEPPGPEELKAAFSRVSHAFALDGDGPRFMQDLTLAQECDAISPTERQGRTWPVEKLIFRVALSEPGVSSDEPSGDLGMVKALCLECASSALLSLQLNGPASGRGFRTGLRGAGPLTTIVLGDSLWQTCWANVLEDSDLKPLGDSHRVEPAALFPWLAPARTSEADESTTPDDLHPLQLFWPTPHRVRLLIEPHGGECALCGRAEPAMVSRFLWKNYGVNYRGPFKHPLSPHSVGVDGSPEARRVDSGGVGYRHWLGVVFADGSDDGRREPAAVVHRQLRHGQEDARLWAFGFELKKMNEPVAWHDSTVPLLSCPDQVRELLVALTERVLRAASLAFGETARHLRDACFGPRLRGRKATKSAAVQKSFVFGVESRLWRETEGAFLALLPEIRSALLDGRQVEARIAAWHQRIARDCHNVFDEYSQSSSFDTVDPRRVALAWQKLRRTLHGKRLHEVLGLPEPASVPPGPKKKGRK